MLALERLSKLVAELTFGFGHSSYPASTQSLVSERSQSVPLCPCPSLFRSHTAGNHHRGFGTGSLTIEPILSGTNEVYTGQLGIRRLRLAAPAGMRSSVSPATADWLRVTSRYEQSRAILADVASKGLFL